jgi:hypothetical protein
MLNSNLAPLAPIDYDSWSEVDALGMVVKIDGASYSVINASWTENAHGAGDTLSVTIPLSTNPDFPTQLFRGSPAFLQGDISIGDLTSGSAASEEIVGQSSSIASNADVIIELWVGFPQSPTISAASIQNLQRMFLGEVDVYTGQFDADTVTFKARSLAAHLIDDTLVNVSMNQTVGQFLTAQAAQYGLPAPVVNVSPKNAPFTIQEVLAYDQISGSTIQMSGNDQASIAGMHPIDLAIRGAQCDDTDTWVGVRDGVIHYEAPSLIKRGTAVDLKYGRDWMSLAGTHSPQFSDQVEVRVYAHQPHSRVTTAVRSSSDGSGNVTTTVTSGVGTSAAILGTNQTVSTSTTVNQATGATSTSTTTSSMSGGNTTVTASQGARQTPKQIYKLFVGNASPERATQRAQAYRRQISQHLYQVEGTIPVTKRILAQLSITSLLRIHGLPWGLLNSDAYYPREITWTASVTDGLRAKIDALSLQIAGGGV